MSFDLIRIQYEGDYVGTLVDRKNTLGSLGGIMSTLCSYVGTRVYRWRIEEYRELGKFDSIDLSVEEEDFLSHLRLHDRRKFETLQDMRRALKLRSFG